MNNRQAAEAMERVQVAEWSAKMDPSISHLKDHNSEAYERMLAEQGSRSLAHLLMELDMITKRTVAPGDGPFGPEETMRWQIAVLPPEGAECSFVDQLNAERETYFKKGLEAAENYLRKDAKLSAAAGDFGPVQAIALSLAADAIRSIPIEEVLE